MATKIRRSLYIGLGGTGMKSLLHTKKMFIDTYGEVPPMIGFLGIDTDGGEYNHYLLSAQGEKVQLAANEQLSLPAPGAVDFYRNNKSDFSWVPESNIAAIQLLRGIGAGGVRTNGRFAFAVNRHNVIQRVNEKIDKITNAKIAHSTKYELLSNALPEIHMAFSIAGGTGCGTFLNMASLLRCVLDSKTKITGYAVLPGVFKNLPAVSAYAVPNAYGALVDLDYLMSHGINNEPIELKYIGTSDKITEKPFNSVMFIDNANDNNDHYDNVQDLAEVVSLAMVTAAGELSIAGASIGDNFDQLSIEGSLNVLDKRAWAGGMGACEIVYRGETLAETYQLKAAVNIIDRMFNSCDDANAIANTWIDSTEVRIRENNGQDHVTDFIASPTPRYELNINNYKDPASEVHTNIESNKIKEEVLTKKQEELLERVRTNLRALLVKHINRECGLSLAKDIVNELKAQIFLCLQEMKKEREDLRDKEPKLKTNYEMAITDLVEYAGRFFSTGNGKEERAATVAEAVRKYNMCLIDTQRHDAAITIYNSILGMLDGSAQKLQQIEASLRTVKQSIVEKVTKIQNGANTNSLFQINLAEEDAKSLTVKSEDILIQDFIMQLSGDFKVYGFTEYSASEIEQFIVGFTKTLPGSKAYANRTIDQVMEDIYNKNPEKLKEVLNSAARKSMPLFCFDYRGHQTTGHIIDMMYVGVSNSDTSILAKDDLFENSIPRSLYLNAESDIQFASIGLTDKVIIYHQVGIVPIYALKDIYEYKDKYDNSGFRPSQAFHFDEDLRRRMEEENYAINPKKNYASKAEIVEMWVKGFIYGIIKNERGSYYVKSKALGGKAVAQYWVKLADRRTDAFKIFSEKDQLISKDFHAHFEDELRTKGEAAINELIFDAKAGEGKNYYEKYSQINISMQTLESRPYQDVMDLYEEEVTYILEKL